MRLLFPLSYTSGAGAAIRTPIPAFGGLYPLRLDDGPWQAHEESNLNLNVRSVLSCPLDDAPIKLASAAGFEPAVSGLKGR